MFKTEVKRVLNEFLYDYIQQKQGVVRVDFYCLLQPFDKWGIRDALKTLLHKHSIYDIHASLEEHNNKTYLFVYKGDTVQDTPVVLFSGDW